MREIKLPWMAAEVLPCRAGWIRVPFSEMEDAVGGFCLVGVVGRIMASQRCACPNPWDP